MQKKYAFYSLYFIPFFTLLMASHAPWTSTNFSVLGNRGGRRLAFLFWGALTGNYFYLYTKKLMEFTDCKDQLAQGFLFGALICFVTAVGIPYVPEQVPRLSQLHVQISFLAPLLLGIAQIRFLWLLQKKSGTSFCMQWIFLGILAAGSVMLLFFIGIVSSLLEIFLTLGICLYLWLLHHKLAYFV